MTSTSNFNLPETIHLTSSFITSVFPRVHRHPSSPPQTDTPSPRGSPLLPQPHSVASPSARWKTPDAVMQSHTAVVFAVASLPWGGGAAGSLAGELAVVGPGETLEAAKQGIITRRKRTCGRRPWRLEIILSCRTFYACLPPLLHRWASGDNWTLGGLNMLVVAESGIMWENRRLFISHCLNVFSTNSSGLLDQLWSREMFGSCVVAQPRLSLGLLLVMSYLQFGMFDSFFY